MKIRSYKTIAPAGLTLFAAFGVHAQIYFDFSGDQATSGTELFGNALIPGDGTLHLTDAVVGADGHFLISNIGDGKVVSVPGTTLVIKFSGVISQGFIAGAGHFIGQTLAGGVLFANDPP